MQNDELKKHLLAVAEHLIAIEREVAELSASQLGCQLALSELNKKFDATFDRQYAGLEVSEVKRDAAARPQKALALAERLKALA